MDITEDKHYSIEEEKQKAEETKMKDSAEGLKKEMRQQIEALRAKFRRLLNINDQLPADLKIPRQVNSLHDQEDGGEKRKNASFTPPLQ